MIISSVVAVVWELVYFSRSAKALEITSGGPYNGSNLIVVVVSVVVSVNIQGGPYTSWIGSSPGSYVVSAMTGGP